jgi:hypothetical protein
MTRTSKTPNNRRYRLHTLSKKAGYPCNAMAREVSVAPDDSPGDLPPPCKGINRNI